MLDIDGVLADVRHRLHHVERTPKNWPALFAAAPGDPLLPEGFAVAVHLSAEHEVVYLTGRPESCRKATLSWLRRYGLPDGELLMRGTADRRPAQQTKLVLLRRLARRGVVAVVVDDDPAVVTAARSAGFAAMLADWVPRTAALNEAQGVDGRA